MSEKRRGKIEALAKELYEHGSSSCDQGFIAWDDLPAPMKFCWMAVAEYVSSRFTRVTR